MTPADLRYINTLISKGIVHGKVLELGAGYGGRTTKDLILKSNLSYVGTNLEMAPGVDCVADFSVPESVDRLKAKFGEFDVVLVLNILEHTFDPIAILDNCTRMLNSNGKLVVLTPAVWPIHKYPNDYTRLLPDWYRAYSESRALGIVSDSFVYITNTIELIDSFQPNSGGSWEFFPRQISESTIHDAYSRVVHKLFNTFGRHVFFPAHIAIGCVLRKLSVN